MKLPDKIFGMSTGEEYRRYLERSEKVEGDNPQETVVNRDNQDFSLEDLAYFYRITGIKYKDGIYTTDFCTKHYYLQEHRMSMQNTGNSVM